MLRAISFEQSLNLTDMCQRFFNAYWRYNIFNLNDGRWNALACLNPFGHLTQLNTAFSTQL
ncbi:MULTISPECIES: hypothetical protein [Pantoea]|uniref:hypothetical protein n=1 Tax=Pantoea TaxID=53335 RepID=UPI000D5F4B90|nr:MULTISPECIES: hypothetical protein [Pantoea]MCS3402871.1 hypothetical protein [Pantoea sp. B566]PVY82080.1 hypothetical protein C7427_11378 [Pantoea ananatis]